MPTSDQLSHREDAVKAQEGQLKDARKQGKEVDEHLQVRQSPVARVWSPNLHARTWGMSMHACPCPSPCRPSGHGWCCGCYRRQPIEQTLMNRIAYLAQEEARVDRDIENARRRAAEALTRQVQRGHQDQDVAQTAAELLATLPSAAAQAAPCKLRPHTGAQGGRWP